MAKTIWVKAITLIGPDASKVYFALCAERGLKPDPVEMVASYAGFVVVIDAEGLATVQHRFDI